MQSTALRYFAKFLHISLRAAIGFVIFCAATSLFLSGLGWFQVTLPLWTGALVGLLAAYSVDRLAWCHIGIEQLEVWQDAPRWQFVSVLAVFGLVMGVASWFMLGTFSGDPLCHHGITNGIVAFGVPVRDLGAPDRFLPYHALGNLLAAVLASGIRPVNPSSAIELSLDIVSLCSLALFLAIASVLFGLLRGAFGSSGGPAPLWLCLIYPLLLLGAGPVALAHLIPEVFNSADCYPEFAALTFHPLLQYLGRRSAVPAFVVFTVFVCILLLSARRAFAHVWSPWATMVACFVALSYSSLDMLLAALLLIVGGLFFADLRRTALLGLSALIVAAPFIALQGGFFTASLFNTPLPDAKTFFAWELRAPSLVGFFRGPNLGGVPLSESFALKALAVELPWFLLSIPAACWLLCFKKPSALRNWLFLLLGSSLLMIVVPFFVFFVFSPWDLHRLFFWPTLFAAVLTPFVLQPLCHRRRFVLGIVAVLLLVSCSSALLRIFWRAPNENEGMIGRTAADFRDRLGFDPGRGMTWIASVGVQNLLFMNGARVLAPPFGTAGPVYYVYPPLLLDGFVQNRLASRDTGGANMGLLTGDDLKFLQKNRQGTVEIIERLDVANNERQMELFVVRMSDVASSD